MQKLVFLLFVSAQIFSTSVWATKARLTALGESSNGSLHIRDNRNVFLNPAFVNYLDPAFNAEWGTTTSPKAEGGLIYRGESYNYAVQVGRLGSAVAQIGNNSNRSNLAGGFFTPQNSLDFILGGGDGDLPWGASLHYASSSTDRKDGAGLPDSEARVVTVSGGTWTEQYSAYLDFDLIHESKTELSGGGTEKYQGKPSLRLGGHYQLTENRRLGAALTVSSGNTDDGAAVKAAVSAQIIDIHVFERLEAGTSDAYLFYKAGLIRDVSKADFDAAGAVTEETTYLYLPVSLGLEAPAASWLNLRASVSQNMILDETESVTASTELTTSSLEDTRVGAGASLLFEGFRIDGTFAGVTSGSLNGATLFADVSMYYSF